MIGDGRSATERDQRINAFKSDLSNNWGTLYHNEGEFLDKHSEYYEDAKSAWDNMAPILETRQ
jgi:hypothetical protein